MRHKMSTVALIWLSIVATADASEEGNPLPETEQVKTISIEFDHPRLDDVEFTAAPEDWKAIRANLLPAKRDPNPSKWEWFGTVNIVKNDGQPFQIELYKPSERLGAFSAGKTYKDRVYFRGGKTAQLIRAVNAAYEKSKKEDNRHGGSASNVQCGYTWSRKERAS